MTLVLGYWDRCLVEPSQFMKVSSQAWQTPTVHVSIFRSRAMIRFCSAARPNTKKLQISRNAKLNQLVGPFTSKP